MSARPKRRKRVSFIAILLVMLAFGYTGYAMLHNSQSQGPSSITSIVPSSSQATAFVETFRDDQRNWQPSSPTNGLTATLSNQQFVLSIGNVPATDYYFPYPAATGTLPTTFMLSTQITHDQGSPLAFYGLAFHLSQSGGIVHSYAFVVNDNGQFEFLKFDPTAQVIPTVLQMGSLPSSIHLAIHQQCTILVSAHNQSFTFAVNGITITMSGSATTTDTTSSARYASGQLALLVTGTNSRFSVKKVQLSLS